MFGKLWNKLATWLGGFRNPARRNGEYIATARVILKDIETLQNERMAKFLTEIIPTCYKEIVTFLKEAEDKKLPYLEVYEHLISYVDPADLITVIEARCGQVAEEMYRLYSSDLLPALVTAVPAAGALLSQSELHPDLRTQKVIQTQVALKQHLSPLYIELQRLAHSREKLASYFPQLKHLCGDGKINWGDVVSGGLVGFMANAHPIIAGLSWLAKFFRDREKEKQAQVFLDNANREFLEYVQGWGRAASLNESIIAGQAKEIQERTNKICDGAMTRLLHDLNEAGHSLKRVAKTLRHLLARYQSELQPQG